MKVITVMISDMQTPLDVEKSGDYRMLIPIGDGFAEDTAALATYLEEHVGRLAAEGLRIKESR